MLWLFHCVGLRLRYILANSIDDRCFDPLLLLCSVGSYRFLTWSFLLFHFHCCRMRSLVAYSFHPVTMWNVDCFLLLPLLLFHYGRSLSLSSHCLLSIVHLVWLRSMYCHWSSSHSSCRRWSLVVFHPHIHSKLKMSLRSFLHRSLLSHRSSSFDPDRYWYDLLLSILDRHRPVLLAFHCHPIYSRCLLLPCHTILLRYPLPHCLYRSIQMWSFL